MKSILSGAPAACLSHTQDNRPDGDQTPSLPRFGAPSAVHIRAAGKNTPESFVADFAVFDPATGASTALAPLQMARGNAQMVATDDGRLIVLGGRAFLNDEAIVRAAHGQAHSEGSHRSLGMRGGWLSEGFFRAASGGSFPLPG